MGFIKDPNMVNEKLIFCFKAGVKMVFPPRESRASFIELAVVRGIMENYDFSGLTGLVVDDSRFMRQCLEHLLRALGVGNVLTAQNGFEAYDQCCRHNPDFVFTDWDMDFQDGPTFVKRIRTDPESPNPFMPVIMLTGYAEHRRVLQARDFGVTEFIVKPISAAVVYKRLVALVDSPRPFVNSGTGYFGPCRRRVELAEYGCANRRMQKPYEFDAVA